MDVKNILVENVYTCAFSVGQPTSFRQPKKQALSIADVNNKW